MVREVERKATGGLLMVAVLLWRPRGLYPVTSR